MTKTIINVKHDLLKNLKLYCGGGLWAAISVGVAAAKLTMTLAMLQVKVFYIPSPTNQ